MHHGPSSLTTTVREVQHMADGSYREVQQMSHSQEFVDDYESVTLQDLGIEPEGKFLNPLKYTGFLYELVQSKNQVYHKYNLCTHTHIFW